MPEKMSYEELRDKYGEWVTRAQIREFSGIEVTKSKNAWVVRGVDRKKGSVIGIGQTCSIAYKLSSVLRNIEERGERDLSLKGLKKRQKLCRTCRWRSAEQNRGGDAIFCAYCLQVDHHTKHWHKEHGMPNALDMLRCPFYEEGDSEKLPMSEWFYTEKMGGDINRAKR